MTAAGESEAIRPQEVIRSHSGQGRWRVLCSPTGAINVHPVIRCLRGLPKSMNRPGYRHGLGCGHLDVLGGSLLIRLASAGLAFGLNMLVARLAGAEQYGIYSYVLAWLGLLALVATAGMDVATVKYVAAYCATGAWTRLRGLLVWSRRLVLTLALLIGGLGALVAVVTWDRPGVPLASAIAAGCAALPFLALLRLNEARLEGHRRVLLAQIPGNILRPAVVAAAATLVFWLPSRSLSAAEGMALQAVALGAAYATSALLVRRTCPPPTGTGVDHAKTEWLRTALPLGAAAALHVLMARIDTLLVATLRGMTEAGIYAVANRTTELIVFGANAGQVAVRPYVSAFHAGGRKSELQRAVTTASRAGAAFALPVCGTLLFWGPEVLGLFGNEFTEGAPAAAVLAIGYLFVACTCSVDTVMSMAGLQRANTRVLAASLALKVPLAYVAVSRHGVMGLAAVSSAVMVMRYLGNLYVVRRTLAIEASAFRSSARR